MNLDDPVKIWGALSSQHLVHGAHDVIAITSPQKNDLCTEELRDRAQVMKLLSHWTRSVYHQELDSVFYFLGREGALELTLA